MINKFNQFTSCPLMNMHNIFRYSGVKLSEPESLSSHIVEVQMMGYMILDHLNHTYNEGLDYGLYLEKALHHDLEESLTGDVSRPLKYHNPKVLKELQDVAEHTARELYTKYFDNYYRMIQLWDNAKHGKEGILVKIVDMQIVVQKAFGCARLFGAAQFVQGIAMQIPNLHDGYTPLCFFSQQLQQLFGVHGQDRAVCPTGNGVGQRLLGLLQLHDLFLNGVLRDQPVHLYRVALTDAAV